MRHYKYVLFIGRCQIAHNIHIQHIYTCLSRGEKAIVALGSHDCAPSPKNPFTSQEREEMIRTCFTSVENERIMFIYLHDFTYQDEVWVANLLNKVNELTDGCSHNEIGLIHSRKEGDRSTYYLDLLPYAPIRIKVEKEMSSTDIREAYFEGYNLTNVHKEVDSWLKNWATTPAYYEREAEYMSNKKYVSQYKDNEFPQINVTTDYILERSGHVLLIRRKFNPGKGLLALPGGYLEHSLTLEQSAIKELKEETRIKHNLDQIKDCVVASRPFDGIDRDLRCRTITFAYYSVLPNGPLPQVRGGDDAAFAKWIPKSELPLFRNQMYGDHYHILQWFFNNCAVSA